VCVCVCVHTVAFYEPKWKAFESTVTKVGKKGPGAPHRNTAILQKHRDLSAHLTLSFVSLTFPLTDFKYAVRAFARWFTSFD